MSVKLPDGDYVPPDKPKTPVEQAIQEVRESFEHFDRRVTEGDATKILLAAKVLYADAEWLVRVLRKADR